MSTRIRPSLLALAFSLLVVGGLGAQTPSGPPPASMPILIRVDRGFFESPAFQDLVAASAAGNEGGLARATEAIEAHPALFGGLVELDFLFSSLDGEAAKDFVGSLSYGMPATGLLQAESEPAADNSNGRPLRIVDLGGEPVYASASGNRVYFAAKPETLRDYLASGASMDFGPLEAGSLWMGMRTDQGGSLGVLAQDGISWVALRLSLSAGEGVRAALDLYFADLALVDPWSHLIEGMALVMRGMGEFPPDYAGVLAPALTGQAREAFRMIRDLRSETVGGRVSLAFDFDLETLRAAMEKQARGR